MVVSKLALEYTRLIGRQQRHARDLRHTAVSRMLDAGIPIAKVAKIVGSSPASMVRMAARYGHFALDELRSAIESIRRPEIHEGSSVISPVSESTSVASRVN
jgi:integrase